MIFCRRRGAGPSAGRRPSGLSRARRSSGPPFRLLPGRPPRAGSRSPTPLFAIACRVITTFYVTVIRGIVFVSIGVVIVVRVGLIVIVGVGVGVIVIVCR